MTCPSYYTPPKEEDDDNECATVGYFLLSIYTTAFIGAMIAGVIDDEESDLTILLTEIFGGLCGIVNIIGMVAICFKPGAELVSFMCYSWLFFAFVAFVRSVIDLNCCMESHWTNRECFANMFRYLIMVACIAGCCGCFVGATTTKTKARIIYYPVRAFSPNQLQLHRRHTK